MHQPTASFGQRLRQLRVRAGLSQAALAERAGLAVAAVAALERGVRRSPYAQTVGALAEALGLTSEERAAFADASGRSVPPRSTVTPRSTVVVPVPLPRLPTPLTSLIGREVEAGTARAVLDPSTSTVRLLTLVGPGGVGKTRLALAVATSLGGAFTDGVVFVDLAPLRDHRLVPATVCWTLGLREAGGQSAHDLLLAHLAERQMLLVLDNFEHLLGASALLAELLAGCARLALLVTSRTALNLRGERRFEVAPLAPPAADVQSAEKVALSPAVQLFLERASAVAPDFALHATNAAAVAGVCRRLDGIPLALELAAARIPMLSPAALLRRLEHRLGLLTGGSADLPARQRTLRNTLVWSYELLDEAERTLFRRLSVFVGGWTLDAAEMVCSGGALPSADVLDVLGSLTDKSLVQHLGGSVGEPRFGMLETIREYADECLGDSGEARAICELHRDWCLKLVEQERDLSDFGSAQIKRLDLEQDNLRAALRWSIGCDEAEAGLRLGIGCFSLWYVRGRYAEGRDWFGELLGLASSAACLPVHRGRALALAGYLASLEGQTATADSLLHKGLATAEQAEDAEGVCLSSRLLGNLARQRGALAEAESRYEQVLTLARHEGGQATREMRGHEMWTTYLLAIVRYERGDAVGANVFVAQALELSRAHNYPAVLARALALSGLLAAHTGDHDLAQRQIDASLAMLVELGDRQGLAYTHLQAGQVAMDRDASLDAAEHLAIGLAIARDTHERVLLARGLEGVAELLADADPRRALRLVGTAMAIRQTSGLQLTPVERVRMGTWTEPVRRALGPGTADQALEAGGVESVQSAVADALELSNSIFAEIAYEDCSKSG